MSGNVEQADILENDILDEINKLVETLTTSGQKSLSPNDIKQLKKLCKNSDGYIEHLHHRLLNSLELQHAEIRYSTFQIIDEFFMRSHFFRTLVLSKFKKIMELCIEINKPNVSAKERLLPTQTADELIHFTLKRILIWHKTFSVSYPKLGPGITYLKKGRRFNFHDIEQEIEVEEEAEKMSSELLEAQRQRNLLVLRSEINDALPEIELCLTQLKNAIDLLLPPIDEFFDDSNVPDEGNGDTREFGMATLHGYSVNIDLSQPNLTVNEDNEDVFRTATEQYKLANKRYRSRMERWIKALKDYKAEASLLGKLERLRTNLLAQFEQYRKFNTQHEADDSSDDDFEEVEDKEGYESECETIASVSNSASKRTVSCTSYTPSTSNTLHPADVTNPSNKSGGFVSHDNADDDSQKDPSSIQRNFDSINTSIDRCVPTSSNMKINEEDAPCSSSSSLDLSRREKLMLVAPVLPYSLDLHYWEDRTPVPSFLYRADASHRFLKPNEPDDIIVPKGVTESIFTRRISLSSKFEPVKRKCRFPMSDGNLCQRMDRKVCPFHGQIIDRDATGQPTNSCEAETLERRRKQLEAKKLEESKKIKRKKYPNLTDIKARSNTTRRRLRKKVLSKKSLARVSEALDTIDKRIKKEKFGHTFVSVLGSK